MPFSGYSDFHPVDVDVLNRVFLRLCIDRRCAANEAAKEYLAEEIVALYNNGIDTEADLLAALEERDLNRHLGA